MTPDPRDEAYREALRAERLSGLVLIAVGVVGFGLVYLVWRIGPLAPPAPPGIPAGVGSMLSPVACLVPVGVIGSTILILLGLRKLLFAE